MHGATIRIFKSHTPLHWYLIGRNTIDPPPVVIAQQYSSSTFVSVRLFFPQGKIYYVFFFFAFCKNCVT